MMRLLLPVALLTFSTVAHGAGDASKAEVEFICGTAPGSHAFATSGSIQCEDDRGEIRKDLASNSKQVACFYSAMCSPVTPRIKRKVEERTKKSWSQTSDDELNQAVIELSSSLGQKATGGELDPSVTTVQCVGNRTSQGNPDCPRVNECVNQRTSSVFWKIVPMNVSTTPSISDSQGFRIEKSEKGAPQRTAPRGTIQ